MMKFVRKLLWRILGVDYQSMLWKIDYILLKQDKYADIGLKTYDNGAKVWRWTEASLSIGKYCSIAYNVNFIVDEGYHSLSQLTSFPLISNFFERDDYINGDSKKEYLTKFEQKAGIIIGNDVWIGMGAFIMPGVSVGNGATVAANAVVTHNVPDYAVVAGVPAKIIRMKHDEATIEKLNAIAWWNWNESLIKSRVADFYSSTDSFIDKYFL